MPAEEPATFSCRPSASADTSLERSTAFQTDVHSTTIPERPDVSPDLSSVEKADEATVPFGIEFCSGTAGLTAQLRRHGMTASFGADNIIKPATKAPVVKLDLTEPGAEELAKSYIDSLQCAYTHWGVPCGTGSRAREIALPGGGGPKPLRSEDYPEGLPNLQGKDALRVEKANQIYEIACRLILYCHYRKIHWSIEQPRRALFWWTKYWAMVLQHLDPYYVDFETCMYGSGRAKKTRLATSLAELQDLNRSCDGNHQHQPWGATTKGFATADEVEYPLKLCEQWAAIVANTLAASFSLKASWLPAHPDKKARSATMKQTRKSIAFMPEYNKVDTVKLSQAPPFQPGSKLATSFQTVPAYARILRVTPPTPSEMGGESRAGGGRAHWEVAFGVPWTEDGFLEEAVRRGHPCNLDEGVSAPMRRAIKMNATMDPQQIILMRAQWLKKWLTRASELAQDEARLRGTMPSHMVKILEGKRLLVLREILAAENYPDLGVVGAIQNGFDLVGVAEAGGALPYDFQPATLTVDDLVSQSHKSNQAIWHSTKSSGTPGTDQALWDKTMAEVESGWLKTLPSLPNDGGRISRRFAVVQGDKIRPIDNYSESQVNSAVSIACKCTVDGVDTISALGALLMRALRDNGKNPAILGRSFDLKSAYRQLGVSTGSLRWSRIAVFNPVAGETQAFQQFSLPFGAKSSVVGFLRCARLLQWLGLRLGLVISCYFDDYVCLSPVATAGSCERTFATLLDLLGWRYDTSGDKADEMSPQVTALGVTFDLSQSGSGVVLVANTPKRIAEISKTIEELFFSGKLSAGDASSLRGRLGFAEGQLFGRAIKKLISELGGHAANSARGPTLGESTIIALQDVLERLSCAAPRRVEADIGDVVFLFTDASFESEAKSGGVGGVLVNCQGIVTSWFGCPVSKDFCASFMAEGQQQAIGELEAFAVLVAYKLWKQQLRSKHVVAFLDNEGSRFLILKGYSKNPVLDCVVHEIALQEEEACALAWYARVPTEANIADHPSRLVAHQLLSPNTEVKVTDLQKILDEARGRRP